MGGLESSERDGLSWGDGWSMLKAKREEELPAEICRKSGDLKSKLRVRMQKWKEMPARSVGFACLDRV